LLAIDDGSTFLAMSSDAIVDMNGNAVVAVDSPAMQVHSYTEDATPPTLDSYSLNMSSASLLMTFSETVDAATVNPTALKMQGRANTTGEATGTSAYVYQITGGVKSTTDSTVVEVLFTHADMNNLRELSAVAASRESTFLSYSDLLVKDTNGKAVVPRSAGTGLQATEFTKDTIAPAIVQFSLDLTAATITISFSETVEAASIKPTKLTLQSAASVSTDSEPEPESEPESEGTSYTIVGATVSTSDSDTIVVTINTTDLNEIKRLSGLCTELDNCYLSATAEAGNDMNTNSLIAVPATNAMGAYGLARDTQGPILEEFTLNLDDGNISLTFD
jgi:hypothetical protein